MLVDLNDSLRTVLEGAGAFKMLVSAAQTYAKTAKLPTASVVMMLQASLMRADHDAQMAEKEAEFGKRLSAVLAREAA